MHMNIEQKTERIEALAAERVAAEPGFFLVEVKLRPGNKIQVLVDADQGVMLQNCVDLNRSLYKDITDAGLFPPGEFELEVSSPGLDEPLKLPRQYKKNIGRQVEVLLKDGRKITGTLQAADEAGIQVQEVKGKGKKQETVLHHFLTDQIKATKIQIVF